jgi:hypothetical protein
LRIEQAGGAGEACERLGEPRLRMAEHVHGVMLAEGTDKVKSRRAGRYARERPRNQSFRMVLDGGNVV